MCGICGILGQPSESITKNMTQAMERRGPDGEGFYSDSFVSLGVRRLQITGPLENDQPIWNEDHTICITFNGEIYNFRELRAQLESKGHIFRSSSDTEVILHLYEDLGEDCVQYLKGMFAFAIWDGKQLFLARDRMGIKPLFYSYDVAENKFCFASEIKALIDSPEALNPDDIESLSELEVFGYVMQPGRTLFVDVRQLRPGTTMTVSKSNGSIVTKEHVFSSQPIVKVVNCEQANRIVVDELETALRASCKAIVNHDTLPKALFLSGGLDSSLLAVLCSEESSMPLHTFTLGDSASSDDVLYARKVASSIGSIHHEIIVDAKECIREYPNFLTACETIPGNGVFDKHGDFAFFLLSKHIAQEFKVAICGEGADELFGGYWMHRWPLGYFDKLKERVGSLGRHERLRIDNQLEIWFSEHEDEDEYRKGVFNMLLGTGLSNYHLWAVDRASMWHGLEVRVPYLYDAVLKSAAWIGVQNGTNQVAGKVALKLVAARVFEEYSLQPIIDRQKMAMPDALANTNIEVAL